jgi:hypothetical protein
MATKKTHTDRVKATVWTPDMRVDFESNRMGAVVMLFKSLGTQELRSKALALCHEANAEMMAREEEVRLRSADGFIKEVTEAIKDAGAPA